MSAICAICLHGPDLCGQFHTMPTETPGNCVYFAKMRQGGGAIPDGLAERKLWVMGFDEAERACIVEVAKIPECPVGPVGLGRLIHHGQATLLNRLFSFALTEVTNA